MLLSIVFRPIITFDKMGRYKYKLPIRATKLTSTVINALPTIVYDFVTAKFLILYDVYDNK